MKRKMIRKGEMTMPVILGMVLLGIVIGVILFTQVPLLKEGAKKTNDQLAQSKDSDEDGVPNLIDNCDCKPGDGSVRGCPDPYNPADKIVDGNKCIV